MNRREAISALMVLPVARVASVPAGSDDVLVLECDLRLTQSQVDLLKTQMKEIWPNRQAIVMGPGMRLKTVPK